MVGSRAGIPNSPEPIKDDHSVLSGKTAEVGESVQEMFPRGAEAVPGKLPELRFSEDKVIPVDHDHTFLGWRSVLRFGLPVVVSRINPCTYRRTPNGSELPQHNLFKFPIVNTLQTVDSELSLRSPVLFFQRRGQVHVVSDLLPGDIEAGTVGAEDRVRRPGQVPLRQICRLLEQARLVMAWSVARGMHRDFSEAMGIGENYLRIVSELTDRYFTTHATEGILLFRILQFRVHGSQITDGASKMLRREVQFEVKHRLEQPALRLHQSLAESSPCRLAEVASLSVFGVRPPIYQRDAQVREL